jgi:hypothetical protein
MGAYCYNAMAPKLIKRATLSNGLTALVVPYNFLFKPIGGWSRRLESIRQRRIVNLTKARVNRWYDQKLDLSWIVLTDKTGEILPGMTAWQVKPSSNPIVVDDEIDWKAFKGYIAMAKIITVLEAIHA